MTTIQETQERQIRAARPAAVADRKETGAVSCSSCAMRHLCLPSELSEADFARLDDMVRNWRMIKRGESLYRAGDPFHNLYAVRAGSFKTVVRHDDGREQVTGFYLAGESFGLEGISTDRHSQHAIALEDSAVCILPFHLLECLCQEVRAMQQHLHRMMSAEIVRESGLLLMLGNMSAGERVAALLLNLSRRLQARGYSPSEFVLRMTREDIGCYLGLTIETVSRMFSQFQRMGLIQVQHRQIRLLDLEGLARV